MRTKARRVPRGAALLGTVSESEGGTMNLLQNASDDQVALIGCLVALVGSMALMYVSYFVGPAARRARPNESRGTTRLFPNRSSGLAGDASRDRAA